MGRQYIDPVLFTRLLLAPLRRSAATLPTQCAICNDWSDARICGRCRQRFSAVAPRCESCALRVPDGVTRCGDCIKRPPPFNRTLTAFDYAHPWDGLITKLKFQAALDLAPALARCLADTWAASAWPRPGLLLPMPLSPQRLRDRGYNQAWEIARRLARRLRCDADARLLLRIKDTPHQLAFPPERRAANVRGAFAVEPTRRAELRGREVTLVDDVMTTDATAVEMAEVLRQAGAAQVNVWVLARTPAPGG
jgi:ComF family protein